jgi:hypothetical protein
MAAVLGPIRANAEPITYDFVGVIGSVSGSFWSSSLIGQTVTGTYTIDYANGTSGFGSPGSTTQEWEVAEQTGPGYGSALSSSYVFSSTLNVGGGLYAYATGAPGSYSSESSMHGLIDGFATPTLNASEIQCAGSGDTCIESYFQIGALPSGYSANGLPNFAPGQPFASEVGGINVLVNGAFSGLSYDITSATPVPLPAAAWLLFTGLGVLTRRRPTK